MKDTFTPGPWRLLTFDAIGEPFYGVQMGREGGFRIVGPHAEANARLIVQAPAMLAALVAVKQLVNEALPKFNWSASALDANAIRLLNDVPLIVQRAIHAATEEGIADGSDD